MLCVAQHDKKGIHSDARQTYGKVSCVCSNVVYSKPMPVLTNAVLVRVAGYLSGTPVLAYGMLCVIVVHHNAMMGISGAFVWCRGQSVRRKP